MTGNINKAAIATPVSKETKT